MMTGNWIEHWGVVTNQKGFPLNCNNFKSQFNNEAFLFFFSNAIEICYYYFFILEIEIKTLFFMKIRACAHIYKNLITKIL